MDHYTTRYNAAVYKTRYAEFYLSGEQTGQHVQAPLDEVRGGGPVRGLFVDGTVRLHEVRHVCVGRQESSVFTTGSMYADANLAAASLVRRQAPTSRTWVS
jgi:hypothetical protein